MQLPERIVLIGPSGSGKSELAHRLAAKTGYRVVDTDALVVERVNMPISSIFETFGEPAFRALESDAVAQACEQTSVVIATGGGAILAEHNWVRMRPNSVIIGLSASADTLVRRVERQTSVEGDVASRPLLSGDAINRMTAMLDARSARYAAADVTIDTEEQSLESVASLALREVARIVQIGRVPKLSLQSSSGRSDIFVSRGVRHVAGQVIRQRWPRAKRVWLVADRNVEDSWGVELRSALADEGLAMSVLTVEPGEHSKRFEEVERLCRAMTEGGVTRRDVVIALGGGVVGDLVGFVASICLRGLPLVQMPTSLLAMVDSSVGGKTGVNLPAGKNLAGAFYQPGLVLIDPEFLRTLPLSEYRSGMAEVFKHALIQPATPLGGTSLLSLLDGVCHLPVSESAITDILSTNIAIKHSVVDADERESGLRMILNFGHTAGHAIEADGFRYRHGEAVAIGMMVAGRIAYRLGRVDDTWLRTVNALLNRAGLPTQFDGDVETVYARLARDKKYLDGSLHWILPNRDGFVEIVTAVPDDVVRSALRESNVASSAV